MKPSDWIIKKAASYRKGREEELAFNPFEHRGTKDEENILSLHMLVKGITDYLDEEWEKRQEAPELTRDS